MSNLIEHPVLLAFIVLVCSPALLPLARFFFDDFETFKSEAGLDYEHDRWLWVLGWPRLSVHLQFKAVGFVGVFAILVGLAYVTASKAFF